MVILSDQSIVTDPGPGGPKTCGSGSRTLYQSPIPLACWIDAFFSKRYGSRSWRIQCLIPHTFVCPFWGQNHLTTHSDAKPFICPVCGHLSSTSANLNSHTSKVNVKEIPNRYSRWGLVLSTVLNSTTTMLLMPSLSFHFFGGCWDASRIVCCCVAVPYPQDPYFFGPPWSGSISQRHGSGSFYHQAKIVPTWYLNRPTILIEWLQVHKITWFLAEGWERWGMTLSHVNRPTILIEF